MATQNVHFVSYLAVSELDFSIHTGAQEVTLLPKGAEVLHLSVEVTEPADAGTLDLGTEATSDAYANDVDLTRRGSNIANATFSTSKALKLIATPTGASRGKVKIRCSYFTPSTSAFEVNV